MQARELGTTRPGDGRYAELIQVAARRSPLTTVRATVAYATQSGVAEFCDLMKGVEGWRTARKQWLVGIDYCRSDPLALRHLGTLGQSQVRIYDGRYVVNRSGCVPRVSFHPKLYVFGSENEREIVVGSGNLSHTGLMQGVEAAAVIGLSGGNEKSLVEKWFRELWKGSVPLDGVAESYAAAYGAVGNRREPVPLEEDEVPESATYHLSGPELRRLRVCTHLWIDAGRLHENRGRGRPGNQLMMKRNSRVFFGFPARDVERDTSIGHVAVSYGGEVREDCSLRFSNNSMDVLTLPIPGRGGPEKYDRELLRFKQIGVRRFELAVGTAGDVRKWRRRSEAIGGAFEMTSGRPWGVY